MWATNSQYGGNSHDSQLLYGTRHVCLFGGRCNGGRRRYGRHPGYRIRHRQFRRWWSRRGGIRKTCKKFPSRSLRSSAATIQTQDVTNLEDLNSFVPNFKISADRATSSTINVYIRGVGQSDPLWGNRAGRWRVHR